MSAVLSAVGQFFFYSVVAVFVQNTVFSRALGVSRLLKLVDDEAIDSLIFSGLICVVQLIASPLAFLANRWISPLPYKEYFRPLLLALCTVIAFFVVLGLVILLFHMDRAKNILTVLPMASFNCCVLGTLLVTTTQSFSFAQTMGYALGAGVGYALAVWLVTEGRRKLESDVVPSTFRGLPITLVYIGILALAVYGLTGHVIAF